MVTADQRAAQARHDALCEALYIVQDIRAGARARDDDERRRHAAALRLVNDALRVAIRERALRERA